MNVTEYLWWYVNIGSGNDFVLSGNKLLFESKLIRSMLSHMTSLDYWKEKTLGLISIRHWSHTPILDQYLKDVDPRVYLCWNVLYICVIHVNQWVFGLWIKVHSFIHSFSLTNPPFLYSLSLPTMETQSASPDDIHDSTISLLKSVNPMNYSRDYNRQWQMGAIITMIWILTCWENEEIWFWIYTKVAHK